MPDAAFIRSEIIWEKLGEEDPLWAILTMPGKENNGWEIEEFFRLGREHFEKHFALATGVKNDFGRLKALDFGCGVGRITQAMSDHFEAVYGVDVSSSMIAKAKELNTKGKKCPLPGEQGR